jgi:hypothetical protein
MCEEYAPSAVLHKAMPIEAILILNLRKPVLLAEALEGPPMMSLCALQVLMFFVIDLFILQYVSAG